MKPREASETLVERAYQVQRNILRLEGQEKGKVASWSRRELAAILCALRSLGQVSEDNLPVVPPYPRPKRL